MGRRYQQRERVSEGTIWVGGISRGRGGVGSESARLTKRTLFPVFEKFKPHLTLREC